MSTTAQIASQFVKSLSPATPQKTPESAVLDSVPIHNFGLDKAARERITMYAQMIKDRLRRAAEDIIEIGQMLREAKKLLPDGQFGAWLYTELPELSLASAEQFIRIANAFKVEDVRGLNIGAQVMTELSLSYVSPKTREIALERAKAGESLSWQKVKSLTRKEREAAKQRRTEVVGDTGGIVLGRLGKLPLKESYIGTLTKYLVDVEADAVTDVGEVPAVCTGACYEFVEDPQPDDVMAAVGRIAIMARALREERSKCFNAVVIIRPTADPRIKTIIQLAAEFDVDVQMFTHSG